MLQIKSSTQWEDGANNFSEEYVARDNSSFKTFW